MDTKEWLRHLPRLPWVNAGMFVFLSIVYIGAQVRGHALSSQAAEAGLTSVRGSKIGTDGSPFLDPGATITINKVTESSPHEASYEVAMRADFYRLWSSVPEGYRVRYSVCANCMVHPEDSFVFGRTVEVVAPMGGYVHVLWQYVRVHGR